MVDNVRYRARVSFRTAIIGYKEDRLAVASLSYYTKRDLSANDIVRDRRPGVFFPFYLVVNDGKAIATWQVDVEDDGGRGDIG